MDDFLSPSFFFCWILKLSSMIMPSGRHFYCFCPCEKGQRTFQLLEVKVLFLFWLPGDANDMRLTSEDANSFFSPVKRFFTSLSHECYEEGCDFEEVEEVMGSSAKAVCLP